MGNTLTPQARVAKWDNAKALLIILVVFGHVLAAYCKTSYGVRVADLIINSFHMPLFMFISGLFSKSTVFSKPFRYDKIVGFFLLFYFMKLLIFLTQLALGQNARFVIFSENGTPWFIFAMGVMYLITRLLRSFDPLKIFFFTIVVSLLVGFIPQINDTMVSSRIFVFYPFFFAGFILDKEKILNFVNKPIVRIISAITLILFCGVVVLFCDKLYGMRALFVGCNSYDELGKAWVPYGVLLRLAAYCISAVVGISVLSLVPNVKIPLFTYCGTKTLSIYALHRPLIHIYHATAFNTMMKGQSSWVILLVSFGLALALSLILMLKPFDYLIYPCTNWRKFFSPVLKFLRKPFKSK